MTHPVLDPQPLSEPMAFEQAWSLDDTRKILQQPKFPSNGTAAEQEAWRRSVGYPGDRALARAIGTHMAWVMEQGVSVVPAHCEGVNTWFLHHLRELAANPSDPECQTDAGLPFVRDMSIYCAMKPRKGPTDAVSIHKALVDLVVGGNFTCVAGDDQTCCNTGIHVNVNLEGWQGVAGTHRLVPDPDRSWGRRVFEPLDPATIVLPQTYAATLPVPSGQLWISDWFRMDAFNDLTKPIDDGEPHDGIQSVEGRAAITRRYAEQLGVGHVFCKSPDIISSMGAITAGKCHCDEETGESARPAGHAGRIEADLRWTTIVDRQHLVELLTPALGQDGAAQQVSDYEASHPDIIKVTVEPGLHHLYFAGEGRTLGQTIEEKFASQGLFLEEDYREPGFVLTQQPLPEATAKPARKSGPSAV